MDGVPGADGDVGEARQELALDQDDQQSLLLLSQWCAGRESVSSARRDGAELVLRRRQSLERVHAVLVAEDTALAS
jgi:hypothetical protein